MSLRVVFAGTPAAAVPSFRTVVAHHEAVAAVTRPPAPQGRKRLLTSSPVARAAEQADVSVLATTRVTPELTAAIRDLKPDVGVVVAYGALLPDELLAVPAHGWINVHFSRLPQWRGAAPVQRAIEAGEQALGVSVIRVVTELDAGPICAEQVFDLGPDVTGDEALALLAEHATPLLEQTLAAIERNELTTRPQQGEPGYARKLTRADGRIDWNEGRTRIYDRIRAMTNEPGAWCLDGELPLKILAAGPAADLTALAPDKDGAPGRVVAERGSVFVQCRDGFVPLRTVQAAGRRAVPATAWLAGHHGERVMLS